MIRVQDRRRNKKASFQDVFLFGMLLLFGTDGGTIQARVGKIVHRTIFALASGLAGAIPKTRQPPFRVPHFP